MEYSAKLEELQDILNKQDPYITKLRALAGDLKELKVKAAPAQKAKDSPQLRAAVAEAKAASEKFGASSPEAAVAWEAVEEIAAADMSPALGGSLADECLVEALDACEAMDKFNQAIALEMSAGSGLNA